MVIFDAFSGPVQDITPGRENIGAFYLGENVPDIIAGRNGDDHIEGFGGNDTLFGGAGMTLCQAELTPISSMAIRVRT